MNEIPLCGVVFSLGIPEEERKLPIAAADIIGNIGQINCEKLETNQYINNTYDFENSTSNISV